MLELILVIDEPPTVAAASSAAALAAAEDAAFCIDRVVKYQAATSEPRPAKPMMADNAIASMIATAPRRSRISCRIAGNGRFRMRGKWGMLLTYWGFKMRNSPKAGA